VNSANQKTLPAHAKVSMVTAQAALDLWQLHADRGKLSKTRLFPFLRSHGAY
jgi:hypothetical protein